MSVLEQTFVQLTAAHRRQARKLVAIRAGWLAGAVGVLLLLADAGLHFPDTARLLLDLGYVAGLVVVVCWSYRRLTRAASPTRRVARLIEGHNPALGNDLISAVEFDETLAASGEPRGSRELMQQQIGIAGQELDRVNRAASLTPPSLRQELWSLVGTIFGIALLALFGWELCRTVVPRFVDPFGDHPPFSATRFTVEPAGATVHYGDSLRVSVVTAGKPPKSVDLVLASGRGQERAALPMFDAGDGSWFQTIENLQAETTYFVRSAQGRSRRFRLSLIPWPRIDTVVVTYEYPAYTHLQPEIRLLHEKILKGYRQTRATLTITSNKPLRGGTLTVGGASLELRPRETNTVSGTFVIAQNGTFSATIVDRDGHPSRDSLQGTVEVVPDLKPAVAIVHPANDSIAIPTAKVPINIEATDDLGVARIEIFRSHNGSTDARKTIHTGTGQERMVNLIETLDLADLGVRPGDTIEFYVTATDTAPDAPQTAATPARRLSIIAFEDYQAYLQTQLRAEQLTQKYDRFNQKLQALADQQEKLAKQVADAAGKPPDQETLAATAAQQDDLARQTDELIKELAAEADTPPLYDVEIDYKVALKALAEKLADARQPMANSAQNLRRAQGAAAAAQRQSRLEEARADQQLALEKLGRYREEYQQGVGEANRDIEKTMKLLEDVEEFKQLLGQQKDLERQTRFYKDQADPNFGDRVRLKELSEQQTAVREALTKLKEKFSAHGEAIAAEHPRAAADARGIAEQIGQRAIEQLMTDASAKLARPEPRGGYQDVQSAYEQMQALMSECEGAAGQAAGECEFRLRMQMHQHLGQTLKQLARAFRFGENGRPGLGTGATGSGADGVAGVAMPFDLFGSEQPAGPTTQSSKLGRRSAEANLKPGEPEPLATSIEELEGSKNTELEVPGGGGERLMEEYRRMIEEYFKRLAEE